MLEDSTASSGPYAGSGQTGPFPITFRFLSNDHLRFVQTDPTGAELTLSTSDWSATGAGGPSGGTGTLVVALAIGYSLTINRVVPLTQLTDYTQSDSFPAESHEDALDKLTMISQQIQRDVNGAVRVPEVVGELPRLPVAAARAQKFLYFDALGNPTVADIGSLATAVAYANNRADPFAGDGVTTNFILQNDPGSIGNTTVTVDGLTYTPDVDYTQTGAQISFVEAPAVDAQILIRYGQALATGVTDASAVDFLQIGTGSVSRNSQDKLREVGLVSVADKGGIPGVDATAASTAAAGSGDEFEYTAGAWLLSSDPTLTGPKRLHARFGATFSGAGTINLGLNTNANFAGEQTVYFNTLADGGPSNYIRRIAKHTGGTAGFVNSAVSIRTDVQGGGSNNFEWPFLVVLDSDATGGENTAAYVQAIKRSTGPTFGATIENIDVRGTADPGTGQVAAEFDIRANGTDANSARVGIDVVITRQYSGGGPSGAAMQAGYGIRVGNGGDASATTLRAYTVLDQAVIGYDTSQATITTAAFRMATNQAIAFTTAADRKLLYDGLGLKLTGSAGAFLFRLNDTGMLQLGIASTAAATPSNFAANRTIRFQQADGTVLYIPAMLATW